MEPQSTKLDTCEGGTEKVVKRRRLGRSLGGRVSSWVPPFATPPSAQKSREECSRDTAEQGRSISCISTPTSARKFSPNVMSEKQANVGSTPMSSHSKVTPKSLGSLSSRKRSRGDFKSPMRNQDEKMQAETTESIESENGKLEARLSELDKEISELKEEGLSEDELQVHIKKIHEYNELKDMTQMLLGRIAMLEGVTTRQLHEEMGLGED